MRLKFEDQRLGLEKAEISAKSNFETLKMALSDEIKSSEKSIAQKTAKKAQCLDDAAQAKGDLEITTAAKAEDETKLSDCLAECAARADEFEKNQVLRKDEIVAISTALKILSSDAVSGNADKHLPQFVQTSLAQLRCPPVRMERVSGWSNFCRRVRRRYTAVILHLLPTAQLMIHLPRSKK